MASSIRRTSCSSFAIRGMSVRGFARGRISLGTYSAAFSAGTGNSPSDDVLSGFRRARLMKIECRSGNAPLVIRAHQDESSQAVASSLFAARSSAAASRISGSAAPNGGPRELLHLTFLSCAPSEILSALSLTQTPHPPLAHAPSQTSLKTVPQPPARRRAAPLAQHGVCKMDYRGMSKMTGGSPILPSTWSGREDLNLRPPAPKFCNPTFARLSGDLRKPPFVCFSVI